MSELKPFGWYRKQYNAPDFGSRSGMEDIPKEQQPCRSREHLPSTHMVIPYGKMYRHVCPSCGHVMYLQGSVRW